MTIKVKDNDKFDQTLIAQKQEQLIKSTFFVIRTRKILKPQQRDKLEFSISIITLF